MGANCINLLLESSRVAFQASDERNFHIFYQLLRSDRQRLQGLGLSALSSEEPGSFLYLSGEGQGTGVDSSVVADVDDGEEFDATIKSMEAVGISGGDASALMQLVAAVLMIGQVSFVDVSDAAGGEGSAVRGDTAAALTASAGFMGLGGGETDAAAALGEALVTNVRELPGSERVVSTNTAAAAADLRDALAKAVYQRLFNWVRACVCECACACEPSSGFASEEEAVALLYLVLALPPPFFFK